MAITKLTTTQIDTVVNAAYAQATGQADLSTALDLSAFSDVGNDDPTLLREKFTGALAGQLIKNWYGDTSYRSSYVDDFFVDAEMWGALMQFIDVEIPHAQQNSAWQNFVSGSSTVGVYTVYLPVVTSKFYTRQEAWAIPIDITGEQWNQAFKDRAGLESFVSYIWLVIDNAITQHMEDMDSANRANFFAEKLEAAANGVAGVHVVDLNEAYCLEKGVSTAFTAEDFLNTEDSLLYMAEQCDLYAGYLQKQTALFNTEGKVKFVPKERLVCQVITAVAKRLDVVGRSGVYHADMTSLPMYRDVTAWESMESLTIEDLSSINVTVTKPDGTTATVAQSYIVGFLADKWCIMHTIVQNRVGSQHFSIEDLTHYELQHVDKYMNNLGQNAVIFVLNDYTPSP